MQNTEKLGYNGKHFTISTHSNEGFEIIADSDKNKIIVPRKEESPIIADLNTVWDINNFLTPRKPVNLGELTP